MNGGIVVPIMRYQAVNWTSLQSVTEDIIIADSVPVAPFARIGLSARIHKLRLAASVNMQFIVQGMNPSDQDGRDFLYVNAGAVVTLGSTPTFDNTFSPIPGAIQLTTIISDVQQPMIRVILRTVAGATSGVNVAWLSADLVMRSSS